MATSVIGLLLFVSSWIGSKGTILDVRLVDGNTPNQGRVEVNIEGVGWNAICGTSWDMSDAIVTCRQLGFSGTQLDVELSEFGSGDLPISPKALFCKGDESSLDECSFRKARCSRGGISVAGAVCHGASYLGCYGDNPLHRPLMGDSYSDLYNMTIGHCVHFCNLRQFVYAGLEFGSECYCGAMDANYTALGQFSDSMCRHMCSGNGLQTCGGIAKMAVHLAVTPTVSLPQQTTVRTPSGLARSSTRDPTPLSSKPISTEPNKTMEVMLYVFAGLLLVCLVVIVGCIMWNCRLRKRLRKSYDLPVATYSTSINAHDGNNAILSYMTLNERRTDGNGYQSLSVQRRGRDGGRADDQFGSGEAVYQEPAVYLEPDGFYKVSKQGQEKPRESNTDELLGGGNEYEELATGPSS